MTFWWTSPSKDTRRERLEANLADSNIPLALRSGLVRYFIIGIIPGSFLQAIITNDEDGANARADMINKPAIPAILEWFNTDAPRDSWGSEEAMKIYAAGQRLRT